MKTFYINRLPHIVPLGGCFFVTFCTHDSIPIHKNLGRNRDYLEAFKTCDRRHDLSAGLINLTWPPMAAIVKSTIEQHEQDLYELLYYCIMPTHVHKVINTGFRSDPRPLHQIMKKVKGASSRMINMELGQTGVFWQAESYDHLIRSDRELAAIGKYILENPVKAGLVTQWEDWPYSFVKYS